MDSYQPEKIPDREITDPETYFNRRNFMKAAVLAGTVAAAGWTFEKFGSLPPRSSGNLAGAGVAATTQEVADGFVVDEPQTSFSDITNFNNFYEFSTGKYEVAPLSADFVTRPWNVVVGGLCSKPATFDVDDIKKIAPAEDRVYRMRCVEAWSMVIPWGGFALSKLLDKVEPLSSARYVAFQTLLDPKRMPNQSESVLDWPYVEGLRMDEAMHPLAILATGLYGKPLPPQDGAPIRLVTPWKYGFKGIKSIVRITLVDKQPPTSWSKAAPQEYGFYANVNPYVDHPRWSQKYERRIGGDDRIETLLFNGYADQVGGMYAGMDLSVDF